MKRNLRIPNGYEIFPGIFVSRLLYSDDEWQIYSTNGSESVLIVGPELAAKWINMGLITRGILIPFYFESSEWFFFTSDDQSQLVPLKTSKGPYNKTEAISFALSMSETRKIDKISPLHDSIYVEKYSRLLPTWSLSSRVDDDVVLGTWLSGGVEISALSFRRLCSLMGWLNPSDIQEVLKFAGYEIKEEPPGGHLRIEYSSAEPRGRSFKLPGRFQLERFFNEHIVDIVLNPERYEILGINFPSAIVLNGPSGCGKTFAVKKLVEFLDWPSFSINSNTIGSPYIHETSKKISEIFDKAIESAPSVLIIDEMESFLSTRAFAGSSNLYHVEEVAEFLRRIPEVISNKVLIIGMTNLLELIDPSIIRRGRFDHTIEVGMPSREEVQDLILSILRDIPTETDIDINPLLDQLAGRALSDITFVLREAARLAARDGKSRLNQRSLLKAMEAMPEQDKKQSRQIGFNIM
jgi:cell division protease FtsH